MKISSVLGSIGVAAALAVTPVAADAQAGQTQGRMSSPPCFQEGGGTAGKIFRTVDATPARVGPYRSCASKVNYRAGATVSIICQVTNRYSNVWYKTADGYSIWSGHFAPSVKNRVASCTTD